MKYLKIQLAAGDQGSEIRGQPPSPKGFGVPRRAEDRRQKTEGSKN
jgi:hypothetical protein